LGNEQPLVPTSGKALLLIRRSNTSKRRFLSLRFDIVVSDEISLFSLGNMAAILGHFA
jgi:hypothetical protein